MQLASDLVLLSGLPSVESSLDLALTGDEGEALELSAPDSPLVPVAWSGGLPIWRAGSGYLVVVE